MLRVAFVLRSTEVHPVFCWFVSPTSFNTRLLSSVAVCSYSAHFDTVSLRAPGGGQASYFCSMDFDTVSLPDFAACCCRRCAACSLLLQALCSVLLAAACVMQLYTYHGPSHYWISNTNPVFWYSTRWPARFLLAAASWIVSPATRIKPEHLMSGFAMEEIATYKHTDGLTHFTYDQNEAVLCCFERYKHLAFLMSFSASFDTRIVGLAN